MLFEIVPGDAVGLDLAVGNVAVSPQLFGPTDVAHLVVGIRDHPKRRVLSRRRLLLQQKQGRFVSRGLGRAGRVAADQKADLIAVQAKAGLLVEFLRLVGTRREGGPGEFLMPQRPPFGQYRIVADQQRKLFGKRGEIMALW